MSILLVSFWVHQQKHLYHSVSQCLVIITLATRSMAQPSESRNSALPIKLDTVASLFYDLAMFRWSLTDNMPKALYSKNMGVHSV